VGDLSQDNAALNARESAVEKKIGWITQKPTAADQIKTGGESVRDRLRKTDNLEKIENAAPKKGLGKVL
jgi:hypothetical protein